MGDSSGSGVILYVTVAIMSANVTIEIYIQYTVVAAYPTLWSVAPDAPPVVAAVILYATIARQFLVFINVVVSPNFPAGDPNILYVVDSATWVKTEVRSNRRLRQTVEYSMRRAPGT